MFSFCILHREHGNCFVSEFVVKKINHDFLACLSGVNHFQVSRKDLAVAIVHGDI